MQIATFGKQVLNAEISHITFMPQTTIALAVEVAIFATPTCPCFLQDNVANLPGGKGDIFP